MNRLTLGYSPDPDDAFMWWAIAPHNGGPARIDTGRFTFECVPIDIQTANERAERVGDLDITGISCAQFPFVSSRYAIASCGSSIGRGHGPKLVARRAMTLEELTDSTSLIASPGRRTTASLLTCLALKCPTDRLRPVPFDQTIARVVQGEFDAAVVIHEGQLTFAQSGLHLVVDLGEWWLGRTGLPLPLGLNVIRRDLDDRYGLGSTRVVGAILRRSVECAMGHRQEAVAHAMAFGRGITHEQADEFIRLYVNDLSLDCRPVGESAIRALLGEGHVAGLLPQWGSIEVV